MIIRLLAIIVTTLCLTANACAAEPLIDRIKSLEPIIGGHPPNIRSEQELGAVKKRYLELKAELDSLLESDPRNQGGLYMRGYLQRMGHNFDYPGAWQGSTDDLTALLSINPAHIPALLELGSLWVDSNPALAPKAEKLFRGAQCQKKLEPLERAQKGIFFALYYQGKVQEAFRQSEYLVQTWPENKQYRELNEITRKVLNRPKSELEAKPVTASKLAMATCNE